MTYQSLIYLVLSPLGHRRKFLKYTNATIAVINLGKFTHQICYSALLLISAPLTVKQLTNSPNRTEYYAHF